MRPRIVDEFTDRPVSRQRKWQLRHPDRQKEMSEAWQKTDKGNEYKRAKMRRMYQKHRSRLIEQSKQKYVKQNI